MSVEQNEQVPQIVITANKEQMHKGVDQLSPITSNVEPSISSTEENIEMVNKENSGVDFLLANNDTTSQISQSDQNDVENENEYYEKNNEYFDSREILKCKEIKVRSTEVHNKCIYIFK